jgi:polyhydroxybutyrate depolymerase
MLRRCLVPIAIAALAACGGSSSDSGASGAGAPGPVADPAAAEPVGPSPATAPADAPPAVASVGCNGTPISGDVDWTVPAGGRERVVHVHVPASYSPGKPIPVVLNFHGFSSNAGQEDLLSGMSRKADEVGFVAVHPEGIGATQSWNAGACCGEAAQTGVDDVDLVSKIIDQLESRLCVDTRRVFATGMSNGGFLSHRLACELSSRIAAVAPVAGVLGIPTCNPSRPMSVLQFHGRLDPLVPYDGSMSMGFPGVEPTMADWAKRSGCSATPRESYRRGEVHCATYDGCGAGAEVSLCTVDGGGHTWPGGLPVPSLGHTTTDIRATDAMWEFFQRHPLP